MGRCHIVGNVSGKPNKRKRFLTRSLFNALFKVFSRAEHSTVLMATFCTSAFFVRTMQYNKVAVTGVPTATLYSVTVFNKFHEVGFCRKNSKIRVGVPLPTGVITPTPPRDQPLDRTVGPMTHLPPKLRCVDVAVVLLREVIDPVEYLPGRPVVRMVLSPARQIR